jgi:predicted  nucleic acid-binding Zn-ribbon protein
VNPFVARRRHAAALAEIEGLRRRVLATEARHDKVEDERRRIAEELAAARTQLADRVDGSTVVDVLEEHDARRKALADALGDQKRHQSWDELIAGVVRLNAAAEAWMADHAAEKRRADELAAGLVEASGEEIKAWEARVKAHWAWKPAADPEKRPIDGASGRPAHPATDLRRALERCRALQALLDGRGKRVAR